MNHHGDVASCTRCGVRRYVKPERGGGECRDCPPEKPWDDWLTEDDVAPIRWVRDGLVWRAEPVQNALETRGSARDVWDNRDEAARCANTYTASDHRSAQPERG